MLAEVQKPKNTVKAKNIKKTSEPVAKVSNIVSNLDDDNTNASNGKTGMSMMISCESNFDDVLRTHPTHMAALPRSKKGRKDAEKLKLTDEDLKPGEIYAMVDSGAGVHGSKKPQACSEEQRSAEPCVSEWAHVYCSTRHKYASP